jgi:hypothetical protein
MNLRFFFIEGKRSNTEFNLLLDLSNIVPSFLKKSTPPTVCKSCEKLASAVPPPNSFEEVGHQQALGMHSLNHLSEIETRISLNQSQKIHS